MSEQKQQRPGSGLTGGIIFGLLFGFLLQKGGVTQYNVLIGQLLLEDFTVIKVMMTAVAVGSVGVFLMHRRGLVELHIKPTRLAAQSIGGLLFGAGFALAAYCPGTGAAAMGQGSWDALVVAAGLILGSAVYALASNKISDTITQWGDLGEKTIPQVLGVSKLGAAIAVATLIAIALLLVQMFLP